MNTELSGTRSIRFFRWCNEVLRDSLAIFTAEPTQRRVTAAILTVTATLLVWKYYGTQTVFIEWFADGIATGKDAAMEKNGTIEVLIPTLAELYRFGMFTLLVGVVPLILVRGVFRMPLREFGFTFGETPLQRRAVMWLILTLVPVFSLVGVVSTLDPAIRAEFPFNPHASDSVWLFSIHVGGYLVYYVAWEFCFRGVIQTLLRAQAGVATAILVQAAISAIIHLGGPAGETFSAIVGGIFWGVLRERTGSLLPGLATHAAMGIALDATLCVGIW